jgi:hypothetical protein
LLLEVSFSSYHHLGGIFPPLNDMRQLFSVADLIGSLDVEEKVRAKDTSGKEIVGASSVNFMQKKNNFSNSHGNKKNNK